MSDFGERSRWLGDAYQVHYSDDPNGPVKKLALVQTPAFVGKFLLDGTLEPALAPFGSITTCPALEGGGVSLEEFRMIDPTCGTGHILCQAFDRLWDKWDVHAPEMPKLERARRVLKSIHGVDMDPLCVQLCRLRLLVAACDAAGVLPYDSARWDLRPQILWADSLLPADHPMQPFAFCHPALTPRYGEYRTPQMEASNGP